MQRNDWSGMTVVVAGLGVSGRSVAEVLAPRVARVITVDEHRPEADVHAFGDVDWTGVDLVVTSPVSIRAPRSSWRRNAGPSR